MAQSSAAQVVVDGHVQREVFRCDVAVVPPVLAEARDPRKPLAKAGSMREKNFSMRAATVDSYVAPVQARFELKGKFATRSGLLLRNSIEIRKACDELAVVPGVLEYDAVAHCGPTL